MQDFAVVRNPSRAEIGRMLKAARGGALRVARDHSNGDIYAWDAAIASHRQMIEHLRLPMADGAGFIHDMRDFERLTH